MQAKEEYYGGSCLHSSHQWRELVLVFQRKMLAVFYQVHCLAVPDIVIELPQFAVGQVLLLDSIERRCKVWLLEIPLPLPPQQLIPSGLELLLDSASFGLILVPFTLSLLHPLNGVLDPRGVYDGDEVGYDYGRKHLSHQDRMDGGPEVQAVVLQFVLWAQSHHDTAGNAQVKYRIKDGCVIAYELESWNKSLRVHKRYYETKQTLEYLKAKKDNLSFIIQQFEEIVKHKHFDAVYEEVYREVNRYEN
jgi:hypothetical protein